MFVFGISVGRCVGLVCLFVCVYVFWMLIKSEASAKAQNRLKRCVTESAENGKVCTYFGFVVIGNSNEFLKTAIEKSFEKSIQILQSLKINNQKAVLLALNGIMEFFSVHEYVYNKLSS